jgi:heterodisulfide reductase subunit B
MARQAGAECIAVACPLCQVNLDLRQADAAKAHGEIPQTPVLYITQLLGLALGLSYDELGMNALTVSAESLLGERGMMAVAARGETS